MNWNKLLKGQLSCALAFKGCKFIQHPRATCYNTYTVNKAFLEHHLFSITCTCTLYWYSLFLKKTKHKTQTKLGSYFTLFNSFILKMKPVCFSFLMFKAFTDLVYVKHFKRQQEVVGNAVFSCLLLSLWSNRDNVSSLWLLVHCWWCQR